MKFTVKFTGAPKSRIDSAVKTAMFALGEQVLTDANYYVRVDQGTLRDSAQVQHNDMTAVISWNTPYARRVYYTGTPSTDVNPNASLMWAEKAADIHGEEWAKILEKGIGDNL